jgi:hypothetical protein
MKLSNIFEQDPDQAAAMGANALKKTMGANTSGAMISKALGKLDQGGAISGPLAKALSPYADALEKILSNPMYRNKFMQMMKQIQTADNKAQAQPAPAVQEDWGSSDGYVLVKAIDDAVAARGLSPEVIQDEAENLAELYYDNMGYDSPEEAVDRIINTWKLRSSTGKALARMFATDESVQEDEQIDEVNANQIKKDIDSGMSHDAVIGKHANKRTTNTDAIRKVIKQHAWDKRMKKEEVQIDELSKKTMGSYVKKASGAEKPKNVMSPKNVPLTNIAAYQGDSETGHFGSRFNQSTYDKAERLRKNRETGIKRAVDKLTKEEVEQMARLRELSGLPTTEGMVDIEYGVDPKLQKLVDIGHLLRKTLDVGSGVKWDDADFNKAANLADALISLGATFGPKNLKDALKLADMDIAQAQELIAKASQRAPVEEAEQLDEILPMLGAMAGRAAFAGAGAVTRGVASAVGHAVGSSLEDSDEDPTDDASSGDEVDTVSMDVPLLLRVLEFAREEVEDDMVLHDVVERLIAMSKDGPLSMDDYESIVGDVEALPAPEEFEEESGKSKQYIEIVSVLGHTKRVPVHPLNAYKALNHYRDQPSTKSARIVSEEQSMDEGYYAPGPEIMPGAAGPQETTTVSFNQSKQMGDATLNINATAKDMDELHRILKLAGVEYDPEGDEQEPDMQVVDAEAPAEEPCGCDDEMPADVKYSTDKQTLINVLRDKLQKRLA